MNIYVFDPLGILTGPFELSAFPEVPGFGQYLPGNTIELENPLAQPEAGHVWALVEGEPQQLADCRGVVFRTEVPGVAEEYSKLGDLPEELTAKPWPGQFYVWAGGDWVLDAPAETAGLAKLARLKRDTLMNQATTAMAPLQDAVDLGVETSEKVALLRLWKLYRIDLSDIEQQAGFPVSIDWPTPPSA
jgi:hypothetical protein